MDPIVPVWRTAVLAALAALAASLCGQCAVVADLTPGPGGSNSDWLCSSFGRRLFWSQITPAEGSELWQWRPGLGASLVVDLTPGPGNSNPQLITAACLAQGPGVIYSAAEIGHGYELYWSDGTVAGTGRLKEIRPGSGSSLPARFTPVGDRVFFSADDGTHGNEPWVTDGTAPGTVLLRDVNPGAVPSNPQQFVALGTRVLFRANQLATGEELWISDGTPAGTQLVRDIRPGPSSSGIWGLTRVGAHVYFAANDGVTGNELWQSDGTAAGTVLVAELQAGGNGTVLDDFLACGDRLLFESNLWTAPGLHAYDTTTGTRTFLGVAGHSLTRSEDRVFFSGISANGRELWITDGTPAGTQEVVDLVPGPTGSDPFRLVDVGNGVVFEATTTTGGELWFSDGTPAGTVHLCTPDPAGNVAIDETTLCNGHLFFLGHTPAAGRELMWLPTPGASKRDLGGASRPDLPTLGFAAGAPPTLGTTVDLVAEGPSNHLGVLLGGDAVDPTAPLVLPGLVDGGYDTVGLLLGQAITLAVSAQPSWSWPLPVPNTASLEGLGLHFQVLWVGAGAPTFQWSNGVRGTLGPALAH